MAEKTRVYYEFRTVNQDGNIIIDKPASITFQLFAGAGLGYRVNINGAFFLIPRADSLNAPYLLPWELTLNNNENEVDVTNYYVRFTGTPTLLLIIKYFENPNE